MKKDLTFEKFDKLLERINCLPFKCGSYWPTKEEIDLIIKEDLDKSLEFLIWITETADEPITDKDKESKKYINSILYKHLKIQ